MRFRRYNLTKEEDLETAIWDDTLFCSQEQRSDMLHAQFRKDRERARLNKKFDKKQKDKKTKTKEKVK